MTWEAVLTQAGLDERLARVALAHNHEADLDPQIGVAPKLCRQA